MQNLGVLPWATLAACLALCSHSIASEVDLGEFRFGLTIDGVSLGIKLDETGEISYAFKEFSSRPVSVFVGQEQPGQFFPGVQVNLIDEDGVVLRTDLVARTIIDRRLSQHRYAVIGEGVSYARAVPLSLIEVCFAERLKYQSNPTYELMDGNFKLFLEYDVTERTKREYDGNERLIDELLRSACIDVTYRSGKGFAVNSDKGE